MACTTDEIRNALFPMIGLVDGEEIRTKSIDFKPGLGRNGDSFERGIRRTRQFLAPGWFCRWRWQLPRNILCSIMVWAKNDVCTDLLTAKRNSWLTFNMAYESSAQTIALYTSDVYRDKQALSSCFSSYLSHLCNDYPTNQRRSEMITTTHTLSTKPKDLQPRQP